MKKVLIATAIAASMALMGNSFAADTGTINFEGEITNSACSLGGGQLGTNMTIQLGLISTNRFAAAGDRSPMVDFTIALVGCDTSVAQNVDVAFAPGAGAVVNSRLLGLENNGGAQGVAIGIQDQDGANVVIGGPATRYGLSDGNNNLNFKAFYESTSATVVAGSANGKAIFTLTYV
ncbi:fimbrial protein [Bordetella genomosp. 12]|uniref:Pilus assembly protein n=1 Tax=Bordetella genomosp. 12 TaxID=463035 RepID=A0A261VTG2_9BORD|nr:fimbrial protein [Bordetella genomosp. 12]OZI77309.1 pilus assembly protein [Bordetella genomosp. 12]